VTTTSNLFLLSFGAVFLFMLFSPRVRKRFPGGRRRTFGMANALYNGQKQQFSGGRGHPCPQFGENTVSKYQYELLCRADLP